VVAVLAFVGGDHDGGVIARPLHVFLHGAFPVGASVVAPVLKKLSNMLLAIYSKEEQCAN
jgi:hypothetical protein